MQPLFKIWFCYIYVACNNSQGYGTLDIWDIFLFIIPLLCSHSLSSEVYWSIFKWLIINLLEFLSLIDYVGMLVTFHDSNNVSSVCNGPLQVCIDLHIWYCTFPLTLWLHLQWCSHCSSWLSASYLFMLTIMSKISVHVSMRVVLGNIKEGLVNTALQLTGQRYFLPIYPAFLTAVAIIQKPNAILLSVSPLIWF
jgi:hypothetical protein